jgi:hypothetical protein
MKYHYSFMVFMIITLLIMTGCASKSPLLIAASKGDMDTAQKLIKNGAIIEEKDKSGYTPLFLAVCDGQASMVRFLIDKGASVNTKNGEGMTPLHYAALNLTPETSNNVIKILLDNGADASIKDNYGNTPLKYAMTYNLENLVLIRTKYDGNDDETSLSYADALRAPSRINPEKGAFLIPQGKEKAYNTAVADCNYLVVPYKGGLLAVTGPIGYGAALAFDAATVPDKFQKCMNKMGFQCLKNCSK